MSEAEHLPSLFEAAIRRACETVPRLSHVDPSRILVLAHRLPPTRLGQTIGMAQPRRPLRIEGHDALYAMGFSAGLLVAGSGDPAYDGGAAEFAGLDTVMHELWHVAEACDGTIRPMRHGTTFDAIVRTMRREYVRAGGEPLPVLARETRVVVRQLGRRDGDAFPVRERVTTLGRLAPITIRYVCPVGHLVVRARRLSRPSSCATCSPRFDARFLFKEKSDE